MANTVTYARGSKALGICQRCGLRALLNELIFDRYYPGLRVHPECYDDRHPQEHLKPVADPVALWKPSPEQGATPPVMSLGTVSGNGIETLWNAADTAGGPRIESYVVYRKAGASAYGLLVTLPVVHSTTFGPTVEPADYTDSVVTGGVTYTYKVVAVDGYGRELVSNEISTTYSSFAYAPIVQINAAGTGAVVFWAASTVTLPLTITSYLVYKSTSGGAYVLVQNSSALSYSETIVRYTNYSYYVVAVDSSGGMSANSNVVTAYTRFDGQWHVQPTGSIVASTSPIIIAITPNSRFMYVVNYQFSPSSLFQFSIGVDGKLTTLSPPSVPIGSAVIAGVSNAAGTRLYVVSNGDQINGLIYQYSIGVDGKLTPLSPANVSCEANNPATIGIYNEQYLYVACGGENGGSFNFADNQLVTFSIHATTGALTRIANTVTLNGIRGGSIYAPGPYLYVTNAGALEVQGKIAQFTIGSNGIPVPMSTASFNLSQASASLGAFIDVTNMILYARMANGNSDVYRIGSGGALVYQNTVANNAALGHPIESYAYGISGSTLLENRLGANGVLIPLSPPSVATSAAINGGLAITPDGLWGYVTHRTSNTIEQFYLT